MDFQQEKYAKGAADYDERIRKTFPFYETIHTAINTVLRVYLGPESELLVVGVGTAAEILELGKTNPNCWPRPDFIGYSVSFRNSCL